MPGRNVADVIRLTCSGADRHRRVTVVAEDVIVSASDAYRVHCFVQSALENARRHARAHSVQVRATASDGIVRVRVVDDGVGMRAASWARVTSSLARQADVDRDALTVYGTPGEGTMVELRVAAAVEALAIAS